MKYQSTTSGCKDKGITKIEFVRKKNSFWLLWIFILKKVKNNFVKSAQKMDSKLCAKKSWDISYCRSVVLLRDTLLLYNLWSIIFLLVWTKIILNLNSVASWFCIIFGLDKLIFFIHFHLLAFLKINIDICGGDHTISLI